MKAEELKERFALSLLIAIFVLVVYSFLVIKVIPLKDESIFLRVVPRLYLFVPPLAGIAFFIMTAFKRPK